MVPLVVGTGVQLEEGMPGWEGSHFQTSQRAVEGAGRIEVVHVAERRAAAVLASVRRLRGPRGCCLHLEVVRRVVGRWELAGAPVGQERVFAEHCLRYTRLAARPASTKSPDHTIAAVDSQQEYGAAG